MRLLIVKNRVALLVAAAACALTAVLGVLAGLLLLAVAIAVHEHHIRLRYRASFRNARRMLAAESRRSDYLESYIDGILTAARGDASETEKRILH